VLTLHREMTYRFTTRGPLAPTSSSPLGERQYFEMTAGTLVGDRINARIAMPGGDWMARSPDGFWRPDVRVPLVTDDEAIILRHYTGLVQQPPRSSVPRARIARQIGRTNTCAWVIAVSNRRRDQGLRAQPTAVPKSSNVFDSLGEALAAAGRRDDALKAFWRAVELDPSNINAQRILKKLR
jgi:tetratricopeptide (TPR) repeat protein